MNQHKPRLLPWLILLTICFMLWQILLLCTINPANDILSILLSSHIAVPVHVIFAELYFVLAQLILYACWVGVVWSMTQMLMERFSIPPRHTILVGFLIWCLSVIVLLLANQVLYPISLFSRLMFGLIPAIWLAKILLGLLLIPLVLAIGLTIIHYFLKARILIRTILILIGITVLTGFVIVHHQLQHSSPSVTTRPNVIIIGLDALRPDYIQFDDSTLTHTPHLDHFLKQSTFFTFALTPLARTFTSWSSILTGQEPRHSHIRFNLIDQHGLQLHNTLSAILQRAGYRTIYATDDRRFSNITKQFGFDQLWGIQTGANDFILGSINDFPLSNLVMNTAVGKTLFPYSFNNRAAYVTYHPKTFIRTLRWHLIKQNKRPVFLAVHFCLPHWPYTWSASHRMPHDTNQRLYDLSINRVDQQFEQFMYLLKQYHFLDHAIVVIISDHGEALNLPGDRVIAKQHYQPGPHSLANHTLFRTLQAIDDEPALNASLGHGTDVLSLSQYQTILAFRVFGPHQNRVAKIKQPASLIDIKPTVLALLGLPSPQTDGQSLTQFFFQHNMPTHHRMLMVETGFTPSAIKASQISVKDAVYQASHFYRIDPRTTHLIFKPEAVKTLIPKKQRAVYYQHWVLALYPMKNCFISVFVNRRTGHWTDDLESTMAKRSPAKKMLHALTAHYGQEINLPLCCELSKHHS